MFKMNTTNLLQNTPQGVTQHRSNFLSNQGRLTNAPNSPSKIGMRADCKNVSQSNITIPGGDQLSNFTSI